MHSCTNRLDEGKGKEKKSMRDAKRHGDRNSKRMREKKREKEREIHLQYSETIERKFG